MVDGELHSELPSHQSGDPGAIEIQQHERGQAALRMKPSMCIASGMLQITVATKDPSRLQKIS
jgi:hypothetical protein